MADSVEQLKQEYGRYTLRKLLFIIICIVLTVTMFWLSLAVGTRQLSLDEAISLFINHLMGNAPDPDSELWYDDNIVWNFRVPRALFSIIAGAGLSVAGAVMQSVMKNPLADPYTTGVSSGALLGASIAIVLGFSLGGSGLDNAGIIINAIVFAMLPVVAIVAMGPFFRKSPASLILAGVAVSYAFSSLTSLLLVTTDSSTLATVYHWQVGTLSDVRWDSVPLVLIFQVVGIAILFPLANKINLMALDDKDAKSMGLDSEKLRMICLVVLSVMAAIIICYVGVIGFVGLVIPHIVRIILGSDNKYLIPASAAFGAAFLLTCDVVSRSINVNASIPVGVVTAFIGAPILLMLIIREKRNVW
jgi:iron complex transport system permease protein